MQRHRVAKRVEKPKLSLDQLLYISQLHNKPKLTTDQLLYLGKILPKRKVPTLDEMIAESKQHRIPTLDEMVAQSKRYANPRKITTLNRNFAKQQQRAYRTEVIRNEVRRVVKIEQEHDLQRRHRLVLEELANRPTWFEGVVQSKGVKITKETLRYLAGTKPVEYTGKVLKFVGPTVLSLYLQGILTPVAGTFAAMFLSNLPITILQMVPRIYKNPKTGLKETGYAIVGLLGATAATEGATHLLGDETTLKKATALVVGNLIGGKFKGVIQGLGQLHAPHGSQTQQTLATDNLLQTAAIRREQERRRLSERGQLSFFQRHRTKLLQGLMVVAMAVTLAHYQHKTGYPLLRTGWKFVRENTYAKAVATQAVAAGLMIPIGRFVNMVQQKIAETFRRAGFRDFHVIPPHVRQRVQARWARHLLEDFTLGNILKATTTTLGQVGGQMAAGATVDAATRRWTTMEDVKIDLGQTYMTAMKKFDDAIKALYKNGEVASVTPEELMAAVDPKVAEQISKPPEEQTDIREWYARRAAEEAKYQDEFLQGLRNEAANKALAAERAARLERYKGKLASRRAGERGRLNEEKIQAEIDKLENRQWNTKAMQEAVKEFFEQHPGLAGATHGRGKYRAAAYHAAKKAATSWNVLGKVGDAYKMARISLKLAKLAANGASKLGTGTQFEEILDTIHEFSQENVIDLPDIQGKTLDAAFASLPKDTQQTLRQFDEKYIQFDLFSTLLAIFAKNPFRTRGQAIGDVVLGPGATDILSEM